MLAEGRTVAHYLEAPGELTVELREPHRILVRSPGNGMGHVPFGLDATYVSPGGGGPVPFAREVRVDFGSNTADRLVATIVKPGTYRLALHRDDGRILERFEPGLELRLELEPTLAVDTGERVLGGGATGFLASIALVTWALGTIPPGREGPRLFHSLLGAAAIGAGTYLGWMLAFGAHPELMDAAVALSFLAGLLAVPIAPFVHLVRRTAFASGRQRGGPSVASG